MKRALLIIMALTLLAPPAMAKDQAVAPNAEAAKIRTAQTVNDTDFRARMAQLVKTDPFKDVVRHPVQPSTDTVGSHALTANLISARTATSTTTSTKSTATTSVPPATPVATVKPATDGARHDSTVINIRTSARNEVLLHITPRCCGQDSVKHAVKKHAKKSIIKKKVVVKQTTKSVDLTTSVLVYTPPAWSAAPPAQAKTFVPSTCSPVHSSIEQELTTDRRIPVACEERSCRRGTVGIAVGAEKHYSGFRPVQYYPNLLESDSDLGEQITLKAQMDVTDFLTGEVLASVGRSGSRFEAEQDFRTTFSTVQGGLLFYPTPRNRVAVYVGPHVGLYHVVDEGKWPNESDYYHFSGRTGAMIGLDIGVEIGLDGNRGDNHWSLDIRGSHTWYDNGDSTITIGRHDDTNKVWGLTAGLNFSWQKCPARIKVVPKEVPCPLPPFPHFVLFDIDSVTVHADDAAKLEALAHALNSDCGRQWHLMIASRGDRIDTDETNLKLGSGRSRSVANILVQAGLDPSRMELRTYGKRVPLVDDRGQVMPPTDPSKLKEWIDRGAPNRSAELVLIPVDN